MWSHSVRDSTLVPSSRGSFPGSSLVNLASRQTSCDTGTPNEIWSTTLPQSSALFRRSNVKSWSNCLDTLTHYLPIPHPNLFGRSWAYGSPKNQHCIRGKGGATWNGNLGSLNETTSHLAVHLQVRQQNLIIIVDSLRSATFFLLLSRFFAACFMNQHLVSEQTAIGVFEVAQNPTPDNRLPLDKKRMLPAGIFITHLIAERLSELKKVDTNELEKRETETIRRAEWTKRAHCWISICAGLPGGKGDKSWTFCSR